VKTASVNVNALLRASRAASSRLVPRVGAATEWRSSALEQLRARGYEKLAWFGIGDEKKKKKKKVSGVEARTILGQNGLNSTRLNRFKTKL